jgi:hypothetical protein
MIPVFERTALWDSSAYLRYDSLPQMAIALALVLSARRKYTPLSTKRLLSAKLRFSIDCARISHYFRDRNGADKQSAALASRKIGDSATVSSTVIVPSLDSRAFNTLETCNADIVTHCQLETFRRALPPSLFRQQMQ